MNRQGIDDGGDLTRHGTVAPAPDRGDILPGQGQSTRSGIRRAVMRAGLALVAVLLAFVAFSDSALADKLTLTPANGTGITAGVGEQVTVGVSLLDTFEGNNLCIGNFETFVNVTVSGGGVTILPSANYSGSGTSASWSAFCGGVGDSRNLVLKVVGPARTTVTITATAEPFFEDEVSPDTQSLVIGANVAPVITGDAAITATTNEDTPVAVTIMASDADGDPLTYAVTSRPGNGAVTGSGATLTYRPAANYNGPDRFTVTVTDNFRTSTTATVDVTVAPVNDAPVANPDLLADIAEDSGPRTISFATLTGNDSPGPANESGQTLTVANVSNPVGGTVRINGTDVVFTPTLNFNGPASFRYTVQDSGTPPLTSASATASFMVTAVNDAPTLAGVAPTATTDALDPYTDAFTVADIETASGVLAVSAAIVDRTGTADGTAGVSGTGADRSLTVTPTPTSAGTLTVRVTVSDGTLSTTADLVLTVNANQPPVASAQAVSTAEDTAVTITLTATDPDGDAVQSFAIADGPSKGTLSAIDGNQITYTPNPDANGADAFTFTASDGFLIGGPATVSLTVEAVNDAPAAAGQTVTTDEDTAVGITLTGSDIDAGTILTFVVVDGPSRGTLSGSGSTLTYSPTEDLNGPDSFTFTVSDGTATSAEAIVSITVGAVNDAPVLVGLPADITGVQATGTGGASVTYSPPTATDVDGDTPIVSCDPAPGSIFVVGTTTVTCTADDGSGADNATAEETFTVTVVDTTLPTVTVPVDFSGDRAIEATGPGGAVLPAGTLAGITATDTVDATLTVACAVDDDAAGAFDGTTVTDTTVFPIATTTVRCAATDGANNTGSATFVVAVRDTTAPTLTVPASITAEATSPGGTVVTYTATATDLVDGNVTPVCAPASGTTFPISTTTVRCVATDSRNNASVAKTFTVTVRDTTGPVITFVGGPQPNRTYTQATLPGEPICTATDAANVVTQCQVYGYSTAPGTHTLTARARDATGNSSVSTRTYTVSASAPTSTPRLPTATPRPTSVPPTATPTRPTRPTTVPVQPTATPVPAQPTARPVTPTVQPTVAPTRPPRR